MKGEPSKKWSLIESVQIKTFNNFKSKVIELIEEIMGEDSNLSTTEWCDKVAVINAGLIYLKKGAKEM